MERQLIGADVKRREDPALLTGSARYTDDITIPEMAHASILRSRYGHARIIDVDASAARAIDRVIDVFTGDDLAESDAPGVLQARALLPDVVVTEMPIIAKERVRYAGEVLAIVVAEDRYTAAEAREAIVVDYERANAVVDARAALADDAPVVHDHAADNIAFDWDFGDEDATREAFEEADTSVSVELRNQRLIGDPMEPRAALARIDEDQLMVTVSSQSPFRDRPSFAEALGLSEENVRIVAPTVGGGFGIKGGRYSDEIATAWVAMRLGRPVKWAATRREAHIADYQSRDWYLDGELALNSLGDILGLRMTCHNTVGAYHVFGPTLSRNFQALVSGQYDIPAIHGRLIGTFTNTTPIAAYRGAGRPEAIFLIERLIHSAARELEVDPVAIRRRNQIPADSFPHETAVGSVYDSGAYERAMDLALERVSYRECRECQADLREQGRFLGIGVSCFVENTGSGPGVAETSRVQLNTDGTVTAFIGTHDHGQGHETTFAQLLSDELGVDYEDIEILEGDTEYLPTGLGTFGSRSTALGGAALLQAAETVRNDAKSVAADRLEVSVDDVEFSNGAFHIAGAPDRSVNLREIAEASGERLAATESYDPPNYGWSFGTHIAVVEVDPETGELAFEDYVAVDDCGVVVNPRIVDGQIHGGVAQGIGQALYEEAVYDESGTLVTGSLQDYSLPKAFHVPDIETDATHTPSPHNPLGVKGSGESGTIAATPAVANAVVDALRPFGVEDIDLPITPEKIWKKIH